MYALKGGGARIRMWIRLSKHVLRVQWPGNTAVQRQTAVTAYLTSKRSLLFVFARHDIPWDLNHIPTCKASYVQVEKGNLFDIIIPDLLEKKYDTWDVQSEVV